MDYYDALAALRQGVPVEQLQDVSEKDMADALRDLEYYVGPRVVVEPTPEVPVDKAPTKVVVVNGVRTQQVDTAEYTDTYDPDKDDWIRVYKETK